MEGIVSDDPGMVPVSGPDAVDDLRPLEAVDELLEVLELRRFVKALLVERPHLLLETEPRQLGRQPQVHRKERPGEPGIGEVEKVSHVADPEILQKRVPVESLPDPFVGTDPVDPLEEDPDGHVDLGDGLKTRHMAADRLEVVEVVQIGLGIPEPPANLEDPGHGRAVDGEVLRKDKAQEDGDHLDVPEDLVEGGDKKLPLFRDVPEVEAGSGTVEPCLHRLGIGNGPVAVVEPVLALPDRLHILPGQAVFLADRRHRLLDLLQMVALAVLFEGDLGVVPVALEKVMLPHRHSPAGRR